MTAQSARDRLYGLLGDLPDRNRPISHEVVSVQPLGDHVLQRLVLDLNGIEPVPALLLRPDDDARRPAVLFSHAHRIEDGKQELITSLPRRQNPAHGIALADRGYAVLCIDAWGFGERATRTESAIFKQMLWEGRVMWGMMVYDSLRALDHLVSLPDVDPDRVGALGLSMGSTMSWWVAALDERIRACVDICCLTDFQTLVELDGLDGHAIYYYVPALLKHFSTADINALIAPRAHLSLAGDADPLTPPAGLDRVDAELQKAYAEAGAPDAWRLMRQPTGHEETPEMRAEMLEFFYLWLGDQAPESQVPVKNGSG